MKNQPYVKQFDSLGKVTNPIDSYLHNHPNRKERRMKPATHRFLGNSNSFHLTVVGTGKFMRRVQWIEDKEGNIKKIYHYVPYNGLFS